ncbi:MAG: hypothetical protein PHQ75_10480 [Thermoguttaceae bacterium]|nr:hypothetical protein [Thermoguttaceae bacterium]
MKQLKINPEFENLLPSLTEEEFNGLEADIIENGCRDAILVWNNVVVDGHNRLRICRKNNIDYTTAERTFASDNAAKIWIWKNQGNRRNLTPLAKIELAAKMKPILEAEAKERQGTRTDLNRKNIVEILPQCSGRVRDELAEQAGVSGRTFDKGLYVLEHADEETKDKLRRGEKGVSISGVYNELKSQEVQDKPVEKEPESNEEQTVEEPSAEEPVTVDNEPTIQGEDVNPYAERIKEIVYGDVEKYHYDCVNLMNIPKYQTIQLRNCLFKLFTADYRVDLIIGLMEEMVDVDGKEVVSDLMKTLKKKFK